MAPHRHTRSPSPCTRRAEEAPRRQQHGRRASGAPGGVRSGHGWRWRECRPECPRRASRRESRAGSPASETRTAAVSEVAYSSPRGSLRRSEGAGGTAAVQKRLATSKRSHLSRPDLYNLLHAFPLDSSSRGAGSIPMKFGATVPSDAMENMKSGLERPPTVIGRFRLEVYS